MHKGFTKKKLKKKTEKPKSLQVCSNPWDSHGHDPANKILMKRNQESLFLGKGEQVSSKPLLFSFSPNEGKKREKKKDMDKII